LADIYPASEQPIPGINSENLCRAVEHANKIYLGPIEDAPSALARLAVQGDVIVTLGAGSVGQMPEKVLAALEISVEGVSVDADAPPLAVGLE
jgi:UDP-N-acetylmuramate--alanine ligase